MNMKKLAIQFVVTALAVLAALAIWNAIQAKRKKLFIGVAYITQGLNDLARVKIQVSMYYDDHGELPSSNEELGLPAPAEFAHDAIRSLTVSPGGVLTVEYNEQSSVDHGLLRFTPDISRPQLGILWKCSTPSFREIENWVPQCKYDG